MRLLITFIAFWLASQSAMARDLIQECAALEPTDDNNISTSVRGDIDGSLEGWIGRLTGASVNLEGEYKKYARDNLHDHPDRVKAYAFQRMLYFACLRPEINVDFEKLMELLINNQVSSSINNEFTPEYECKQFAYIDFEYKIFNIKSNPPLQDSEYEFVDRALRAVFDHHLPDDGRNSFAAEGVLYFDSVGNFLKKSGNKFNTYRDADVRSKDEFATLTEEYRDSILRDKRRLLISYDKSSRFDDIYEMRYFKRDFNSSQNGELAIYIDKYGQLILRDQSYIRTTHFLIADAVNRNVEFDIRRKQIIAECVRYTG